MSDPGDPPYLVVDTNVAVKWYLTEDLEDEALKMLEAGERGDVTLLAPDTIEPEFWNALWKRHKKAKLSLDEVRDYWDAFEESPLLMGEVVPLMSLAESEERRRRSEAEGTPRVVCSEAIL